MEELVKTFHIEVSLLLAQFVNFLIVFLVLYKFAYKPVLKLLNERTEKIEKGLKDAEDAKVKLSEIEKKERDVMGEAKKEAQKIIVAAEDVAKKNKEDILEEARKEAQKILSKAEETLENERNQMMSEVKKEVIELVSLATEKIVKEKVDNDKDKEIISSVVNK